MRSEFDMGCDPPSAVLASCPIRVTIVLVLYKLQAKASPAFVSLTTAMERVRNDLIEIILFDNSPGFGEIPSLPDHVRYIEASRNEGIAGAYNYALDFAQDNNFEWLLTLDQDTTLPPDFLTRMLDHARSRGDREEIAAIVPHLMDRYNAVSPSVVHGWGIRRVSDGFCGIPTGEVHAFNSGSLFRVSALQSVHAFNPEFWLDFLDEWVFTQFASQGKQVFVAGDVIAEHELSVLDFDKRMSEERFENLLGAECAYVDMRNEFFGGTLYTARLCGRAVRAMQRRRSKGIQRAILQMLMRRFRYTRAERLRLWREAMHARTNATG